MNGFWKKSPLTTMFVVVILLAAGTAMAASGVSISTPDDGAATAQRPQLPIGTLSAHRPVETLGNPNSGGVKDSPPATGGPTDNLDPASGGPGSPDTVTLGDRAAGTGGGGGSGGNLPFTGFLAIPVLLAGAGLLAFGAFTRRRTGELPASS